MRTPLALLVLGGALLCACGGGEEKKPNPSDEVNKQLATNVSIFSSKDNQKEWLLQAESVDREEMLRRKREWQKSIAKVSRQRKKDRPDR